MEVEEACRIDLAFVVVVDPVVLLLARRLCGVERVVLRDALFLGT